VKSGNQKPRKSGDKRHKKKMNLFAVAQTYCIEDGCVSDGGIGLYFKSNSSSKNSTIGPHRAPVGGRTGRLVADGLKMFRV
jgi:hypothetical protein